MLLHVASSQRPLQETLIGRSTHALHVCKNSVLNVHELCKSEALHVKFCSFLSIQALEGELGVRKCRLPYSAINFWAFERLTESWNAALPPHRRSHTMDVTRRLVAGGAAGMTACAVVSCGHSQLSSESTRVCHQDETSWKFNSHKQSRIKLQSHRLWNPRYTSKSTGHRVNQYLAPMALSLDAFRM